MIEIHQPGVNRGRYLLVLGFFIPLVFFAVQTCRPGLGSDQQGQEQSGEQALRGRVEEFYKEQQQGNWVKAEDYVAEESKESFRAQRKRQITNFGIESIKIDNAAGKAAVVVQAQVAASFAAQTVKETTSWRLVRGSWCVEIPKQGSGSPQGLGPEGAFAPASSGVTFNPAAHELKFEQLWYRLGRVKDGEVKVARFSFTNISDHEVTLSDVLTGCACLRVKTQQKKYKPGEKGILEIEFDSASLHIKARQVLTQAVLVKTSPDGQLVSLDILADLVPASGEPQKPAKGPAGSSP